MEQIIMWKLSEVNLILISENALKGQHVPSSLMFAVIRPLLKREMYYQTIGQCQISSTTPS
jgi:hypothetical protein